MNLDIKTEEDFHKFLNEKGFNTNYLKSENESGYDIVAVKNGKAYLIEHKRLELRENGVYRFSGPILGDIAALSTPNGNLIFILNDNTSLTKTARFVDEIFS